MIRTVLTIALLLLLLALLPTIGGCVYYHANEVARSKAQEAEARAGAAQALNRMCQAGDREACEAVMDRGVTLEESP